MEMTFHKDPSGFGLRRVKIRREDNGFGFTLRHFIVYPPELYNNDDSRRNKSFSVKVTEPVDTIFVRSVIENGPAFRAGLSVGDRIVSVNGRTIFGISYDAVVHLIQKSPHTLRLEVSPKQYDTLQLFFEETAYRPETNQRPHQQHNSIISSSGKTNLPDPYSYHNPHAGYPNNLWYPSSIPPHDPIYGYSNNTSTESFFLNTPSQPGSMSSQPHPSSSSGSNPHLFSHLPRPTPYKSSSSSSSHQQQLPAPAVVRTTHLNSASSSKISQPQTYYPFNQQDLQSSSSLIGVGGASSHLWKIKEEPNSGAKSAESILTSTTAGGGGGEFHDYYDGSKRSESMECLNNSSSRVPGPLPSSSQPPTHPITTSSDRDRSGNWNPIRPGQRYASYDEAGRRRPDPTFSSSSSQHRRESTGSIPNSNVQSAMVVTMSSTNSKMQQSSHYPHHPEMMSDSSGSSSLVGGYTNNSATAGSGGHGYETKMADRIRRSCEQKEEFLRRPPNNQQPPQWAPHQPSAATTGFPKELYAQPQKFEKIPWPPTHIVPTVTSSKSHPPPIHTSSSGSSFDSQMKNLGNVSVINVQHFPHDYHHHQSPGFNRTSSPPTTTVDRDYESVGGGGTSSLSQNNPSSMYHPSSEPRSLSPSWLEYAPRNRTTIVGSRKLHCDPPPGWNPDMATLSQMFNDGHLSPEIGKHERGGLSPTSAVDGAGGVKLRQRNDDLDENERLVRRVSYLKATSSPIDMDRKSASPTSPTLSSVGVIGKATSPVADVGRRRSVANKLSAEFFPKGRIIRLKQFFEERTHPSKEPKESSIFKFSVDSPTSENRGFGSLLGVRSPDDSEVTRDGTIHYKIRLGESKKGGYNRSWRQGHAQIRKTGCLYISKEPLSRESVTLTEDSVILALSLRSGVSVELAEDYSKRKHVLRIKTSYSSVDIANIAENSFTNTTPNNAHPPPSHSTPVEILIQADDMNDSLLWLQCLQTQLENNNYCNGNNASNNNFKGIYFGPEFCPKPKSLLTSFLPSPANSSHTTTTTSQSSTNTTSHTNTSTLQPGSGTQQHHHNSPKNKTWKGKLNRQWKRVHNIIETGGDSKGGASPYSSIPPVGATFGINLENCPPGERNLLIPRVIEYAIDVVESRGIDMVGLYRIPGNNASVATLTERLNKGEEPNPEKDPKWADVHVVASLIKSFLRRLPDPLLTDDRYPAFIIAADDSEQEKCLERMQLLISDLPDINYETVRAVILHLKKVAEHGEQNRMDARNLAIVFGPTIVRTAEENVTIMVQDMKNQCKIVELLISNADELFSERRFREDQSVSGPRKGPTNSLNIYSSGPLSSSNDELETSYNISDALRLPTVAAVTLYNTTSENTIPPPRLSPSSPTIESELRASLVQAAMRKASQIQSPVKDSNSRHNVYGLPANTSKKGKPIDDRGFIRSYAGLNEETEQRVRKFELETRAMLSREDRSPHSSIVNVGSKQLGGIRLLNLDDELQRAKDDLENDDIYDQLADNPSSIIHHRDRGLFSVGSAQRNLSSCSSISSSNSNGTVPSSSSHPGGAIQKLGPVPFKPTYSLPPKPPQLHNLGGGGGMMNHAPILSKTSVSPSPISPLRRFSSMDRFIQTDNNTNKEQQQQGTVFVQDIGDRKLGVVTTFSPKYIGGSLDSLSNLKDISQVGGNGHSRRAGDVNVMCEDFSPRSSEGSDLVTSLSKTLDKKLEKLRSKSQSDHNPVEEIATSLNGDESHHQEECMESTSPSSSSRKPEMNGGHNLVPNQNTTTPTSSETHTTCVINESTKRPKGKSRGGNGLKKNWRRNSMIERRVTNGDVCNVNIVDVKECTSHHDKDKDYYYRNPSLHRLSGEFTRNATNQIDQTNLSKETKTANNKFTRDCRRRHSLSGGGDILSIAYHDKSILYLDDDPSQLEGNMPPSSTTLSSNNPDCISAANNITRAAILESRV